MNCKLLIIIVLSFLIGCSQYGEKLTFKGIEIYYKNGATINDAINLGEYFFKIGLIKDNKISFQIFKNDDIYVVRMVAIKGKENDKEVIESLKTTCKELADDVFKVNKSKIEFHLCSDRFKTLRVITHSNSYIPK